MFRKIHPLGGVRDSRSQWIERPAEVEKVLWASREKIWGTAPPMSSMVPKLLELYFAEGRRVSMNE